MPLENCDGGTEVGFSVVLEERFIDGDDRERAELQRRTVSRQELEAALYDNFRKWPEHIGRRVAKEFEGVVYHGYVCCCGQEGEQEEEVEEGQGPMWWKVHVSLHSPLQRHITR